MSFKAKDLTYDAAQPAFLQRLRGQLAGDGSGRHEQPVPRNKRLKQDDDDDDAPTYVLEDSNQSLTKAEYDALVAGKDPNNSTDASPDSTNKEPKDVTGKQSKETPDTGKATKKRKAVKIGGGEENDEEQPKKSDTKVAKKQKKKVKPVKLTFGDEEDG